MDVFKSFNVTYRDLIEIILGIHVSQDLSETEMRVSYSVHVKSMDQLIYILTLQLRRTSNFRWR